MQCWGECLICCTDFNRINSFLAVEETWVFGKRDYYNVPWPGLRWFLSRATKESETRGLSLVRLNFPLTYHWTFLISINSLNDLYIYNFILSYIYKYPIHMISILITSARQMNEECKHEKYLISYCKMKCFRSNY